MAGAGDRIQYPVVLTLLCLLRALVPLWLETAASTIPLTR